VRDGVGDFEEKNRQGEVQGPQGNTKWEVAAAARRQVQLKKRADHTLRSGK